MSDISFHHGVRVNESPDTPSIIQYGRNDLTFVNGTSADADVAAYPINMPTVITSTSQLPALGKGWLREAATAIFGEGGSAVIVNRVEHSETAATLQDNLIGDQAAQAGIYAALRAFDLTGFKPRVIITEGDTGAYVQNGALSVALSSGGELLTAAPTIAVSGGGSDAGKVLPTFTAVLGEGDDEDKVVAITINTIGKNMTEPPVLAFSGGGSESGKELPTATVNVGDIANPFIAPLRVVCEKIGARAYVQGPNTTNQDAVRWRAATAGARIFPIDPKGIKYSDGSQLPVSLVPVFAGVRARVVNGAEGVSGSVTNKPILTLDGVTREVRYPDDSNYLLSNQVNTVINRNGLHTWGDYLATDDPIWMIDSVRATADVINDQIHDLYMRHIGRRYTAGNLKNLVEDGNAAMRDYTLQGHILGGSVKLGAANTATQGVQGRVFLDIEFEPVGRISDIDITTHRNIMRYQLVIDTVNGLIENGALGTLAA
jgi:phage tail sheath protein FI